MSAGHTPPPDESDFDDVLNALEQALEYNPHLRDLPAEEVVRQLVLGGYLQDKPPLLLVEEALGAIAAEEQAFGPDIPPEEA
jgi:hypothetical protein